MKTSNNLKYSLLCFLVVPAIIGCVKPENDSRDILLRIGEKELREEEIIEKIPSGLSEGDSVRLFQALVDEWVSNELLSDFARQQLGNLEEIEKKVEDYRSQLIVMEYLSQMTESRSKDVDEKEIRAYYERHKNELKTELPLIKGVFLKINKTAPGKEEIQELLSENKEGNIDKLEQEWLDKCLSYDYFQDKWIDWETVSGLIPFRFGDADKFLENRHYFSTEHGDFTYYLQISDYLPSGSQQPFEFAAPWIGRLLDQESKEEYKEQLIQSLIKKGIKENKLVPESYNPLTRQKEEPLKKIKDEK